MNGWQPGGLWALIDRGTFSAAVMMSADLEMRTPTLLAGEKTGGHPNSYGDSRRVVLAEQRRDGARVEPLLAADEPAGPP